MIDKDTLESTKLSNLNPICIQYDDGYLYYSNRNAFKNSVNGLFKMNLTDYTITKISDEIASEMIVYSGYIYYSKYIPSKENGDNQGEIFKISKDGKEKIMLSNNAFEKGAWRPLSSSLIIANDYLYFIKGYDLYKLGEDACKINLTTKENMPIFTENMYACNLKIDNGWLYFTIGTNNDPSRYKAVNKDLYRRKTRW